MARSQAVYVYSWIFLYCLWSTPLCNLLSSLAIISLYFFHTAEHVLTQKEGCQEVFLLIQPSPPFVNATCRFLSFRAVDILVWIHLPNYPNVQRDTWPQHPADWFLSSNIFSLSYFQSPTSLLRRYGWLHKLEGKGGLRTSSKYSPLNKLR